MCLKKYEDIIQQLVSKVDVQQTIIEELQSKMYIMKENFKYQTEIADLDMTCLRKKYEYLQYRIGVLEDNRPKDAHQIHVDEFHNQLNASSEENKTQPQAHTDVEPKGAPRDNISYTSTSKTNSIDNNSMDDTPKNQSENRKDEKLLKLNPIGVLQELCMYHKWTLPKYEFSEKQDRKKVIYTVECTVESYSVRVEGPKMFVAKRQAATKIYRKLCNIANSDWDPLKNDWQIKVYGHPSMGDGALDDSRDISSAGLDEELATAAFVGPPARPNSSDDNRSPDVNQLPMLEGSKEVVAHQPASPVAHDTAGLTMTTESVDRNEEHAGQSAYETVVVNEEDDDRSLISHENADLALRLGQSQNPGIHELKEFNCVNEITYNGIDLLSQIVEEEGLTMDYEILWATSSTTQNINYGDMTTVQIKINPGALTVVGCGETIYECQVDAINKCLTQIKLMLQEYNLA